MSSKKTIFPLVVSLILILIINLYSQQPSQAQEQIPGPGNACDWGFLWVETSFWPWNNNMTSKLCDCTEVHFKQYGDHKRCTPTNW
jgi:hypothetical protein